MNGLTLKQVAGWNRIWFVFLAVFLALAVTATPVSQVFAQMSSDPAVEGAANDPAKVTPAAPAPKPPESFLGWMIRASGIFGFLILLVSFAMVAIIVMVALQLRRDLFIPSSFVEQFEQHIKLKEYQAAYESARGSDSFIGRVLAEGLSRLSRGYDEAISGMEEVGDDESMAMEHKIGYLALIGSIAPMLGLLGTVQGMVMSFQVIASSSTSPKPSELADGIATALFTTLEGLVVAIPAMVFYSVFKNRLARFLMEAGHLSDNLMKNFQGTPKSTTAPAKI